MPHSVRRILLAQLPIPPGGAREVEGNVPLAPAFLKLYARRQGLERDFEIGILPSKLANTLGDQGLLQAVLEREPDMVGFTCYLWNIERSLWLAQRIKMVRPDVKVLLGGPEITADNRWVLENAAVDYAISGEGEFAFAKLLHALQDRAGARTELPAPCDNDPHLVIDPLDAVSSPYVEGILDAGEHRTLLLETVRGCRFGCKYCYYSKRSAALRYLSPGEIEANLRHAIERGVREVYLLDPTINQRPDFCDFLRLLARCNTDRQLTFSGELRAEGIDAEAAGLLRAANFAELEIGLQSVDPQAQRLMGRNVDFAAWQRGVHALLVEGIRVRLDLILGLPGDTAESIRRGIDCLARFRPEAEIQIFNLSVLPGTEFRRDAAALGLKYQARPPYYVYQTPTLDALSMYSLMGEAQQTLDLQFDAPSLPFESSCTSNSVVAIDLDDSTIAASRCEDIRLVTTLLLHSADFSRTASRAVKTVAEVMKSNPHIALQVVLAPAPQRELIPPEAVHEILDACYRTTSYLDRFYSLQPGHLLGAKHVFVLLPCDARPNSPRAWIQAIGQYAGILWHGDSTPPEDYEEFEHIIAKCPVAL
jgi:hypothetical protein